MGTGRCGTQTFAKMFRLPHEKYKHYDLNSDVAPYYLPYVRYMDKRADIKFVCLKRNREDTVESFVKNRIMKKQEAEQYYDSYYKDAEKLEEEMKNFKIFKTEELDNPERIESFLDKKAEPVKPIRKVCPFFSEQIDN